MIVLGSSTIILNSITISMNIYCLLFGYIIQTTSILEDQKLQKQLLSSIKFQLLSHLLTAHPTYNKATVPRLHVVISIDITLSLQSK